MGSLFILSVIGIPCLLILLWWLTPNGKHWLRQNGLL